MTTNVLDLQSDVAASDSRWSITLSNAIIFVDDTSFDKIFAHNDYICLFAGSSALIQQWKDYIVSNEIELPETELNGQVIAVSVTDSRTGAVIFEHGQIAYELVRFAGSGASAAETCWFVNFDAIRAVESAANVDFYTGGTVKYFHFSGQNNVHLQSHYTEIIAVLKTKGMVMYPNAKIIPIKEAEQTDPRVRQLMDDLASGKESMCAPFPGMHQPMNAEQKRALAKAMMKVKEQR